MIASQVGFHSPSWRDERIPVGLPHSTGS